MTFCDILSPDVDYSCDAIEEVKLNFLMTFTTITIYFY